MPGLRSNTRHAVACAAALAAFGANAANVIYYGGPVISDTEIVMVNWGSNVPSTVTNNLPGFYADVVRSDYWTLMIQYSTAGLNGTDGMPGSGQQLGMGSFVGSYTITPGMCAGTSACTVNATQIDAEIASQIAAQNLPEPTVDAQGYPNTLYMVHFAPNVTIVRGTSQSCVQFCATSDNFDYAGKRQSVVFLPDIGPGTGCAGGCGAGTYLQNATSVASAELGDLTSTPLTASATVLGRPLAWYDQAAGRIGDKCNGQQATIVVGAHTWSAQKLWSNAGNACVSTSSKRVVSPSAGPDGTISPTLPQAVDPPASATFTVTPAAGYTANVSSTCGGALAGATFTTGPVMADCSVTASFAADGVFADGFE